MEKQFYVYIVTNKPNGILYIGVTSDLVKRVAQHKRAEIDGFTKQYGLSHLVWYEIHATAESAIATEKRMKEWQRAWKVRRILDMNPHWNDLYDGFFVDPGLRRDDGVL